MRSTNGQNQLFFECVKIKNDYRLQNVYLFTQRPFSIALTSLGQFCPGPMCPLSGGMWISRGANGLTFPR